MELLLALVGPASQQLGREQPLDEVEVAAVALAPGEADDARLREGLQDGAHLAGGSPVPVDRGSPLEVEAAQGPVVPEALEDVRDRLGMAGEGAIAVLGQEAVPGESEPGQLAGGQQAEHLVVGLEELASLVQEGVRPGRVVVAHPGVQDEVVVAAGHGQRVELDRAEAGEDRAHAVEPGRL